MLRARFLVCILAATLLALGTFCIGLAGLYICSLPPLPGDEWWHFKNVFRSIAAIWLLGPVPACFLDNSGMPMLAVAQFGIPVSLFPVACLLLWEMVWRPLRRWRMRTAGNHSVVAGNYRHARGLVRQERSAGNNVAVVAPSLVDRDKIEWNHPIVEVLAIRETEKELAAFKKLGPQRAKHVTAVLDSDTSNMGLAELALGKTEAGPSTGRSVLVRIENPVVRALRTPSLMREAQSKGVDLKVVSFSLLQTRSGLQMAMPGRFKIDGTPTYRAAVCGSGPLFAQTVFRIARQGYGLEANRPILSLIRTGSGDFPPGALERLQRADLAASIEITDVDADDQVVIERCIAVAVSRKPFLSAVHCTGRSSEEALALALQWERAFVLLRVPAPPIVVYGPKSIEYNVTGMLRPVPEPEAVDGVSATVSADNMARTLHQAYLEQQSRSKGADFGSLPAEAPWSILEEQYKEDNRNHADHLDFKLAVAGYKRAPDPTSGLLKFPLDAVKRLGAVEHARWLAAKAVSGTRYGPVRDDAAGTHPDMVTFDNLTDSARNKDFETIRAIPHLLNQAGYGLHRIAKVPPRDIQVPETDLQIRNVWQCNLNNPLELQQATELADKGSSIEALVDASVRDKLIDRDSTSKQIAAVLSRSQYITHLEVDS